MAWSPLFKVFAAVAAIAVASAATFGGASAQYPEVAGALRLTGGATNAATNASVPYLCRVTDMTGAPMTGVECIITIIGEPGTDAAVGSKTITRITDAKGEAGGNLFTGSTPGTITLLAESQGLSARLVVQVGATLAPVSTGGGQAAAAAGSTAGAAPSIAPSIVPPSTGNAGLASSSRPAGDLALIAMALAVAGSLGLTLVPARRRLR